MKIRKEISMSLLIDDMSNISWGQFLTEEEQHGIQAKHRGKKVLMS